MSDASKQCGDMCLKVCRINGCCPSRLITVMTRRSIMQIKDNGPMRNISKMFKKSGRPLRMILTKTILCRRWPSLEKEDKLGFPINNREKRRLIKGIWCGSWASRSPVSGRERGGSFRGQNRLVEV